jgi:hypothetical protein
VAISDAPQNLETALFRLSGKNSGDDEGHDLPWISGSYPNGAVLPGSKGQIESRVISWQYERN